MLKIRTFMILFAAASLSGACNRYMQSSAAGSVIDPADAAKTVVLHVKNWSTSPMELRTVLNGRTQFAGSVGGSDSTSILLDPQMFPTGSLYVAAIPTDGRGRAVVGPLAAGRGDKIQFTIEPALDQSHAIVIR
jgi:hypothetical protein